MKIVSKILTQATIWKRICELILSPHLTQEIINWQEFLNDFITPKAKCLTLKLRRGGRLMIRGAAIDKFPVAEIFVRDDYRLRRLTPVPNCIIDLGAGIGEFCVYATLCFPKVTIYAYEPDKNAYDLLQKNIAVNSLAKRVNFFPLAVTNKLGLTTLYTSQTSGYASLLAHSPVSQTVTTTTLERIFAMHQVKRVDLLKMDIEGAEYDILYSLSPDIFKKIKRIHLECHDLNSLRCNHRALKKFLEQMGYLVEKKWMFDQKICMLYALHRNLKDF